MKFRPLLWFIFIIVLGTRLLLIAGYTTYDYDAYFHIRQIEQIGNGHFFSDELSYGGRNFIYLPLFHIIIASLSNLVPLNLLIAVIPNLFASLIVFVIYFIAKDLTQEENASLFSAFIAGFVPIFFYETLTSVSPLSLFVPLLFLQIYFFLNLSKSNIVLFGINSFILPLIHPGALVLVFAFFLYLILCRIEGFQFDRKRTELGLFYTLVSISILSVFLKEAFREHGFNVIYQNLPSELVSNFFRSLGIGNAIAGMGVVSLLVGIFICYWSVFRETRQNYYFLLSIALSAGFLLWFKLIPLALGLSIIGILFVVYFAIFYKLFFDFISQTKFAHYKIAVFFVLLVFFILSSLIPAFAFSQTRASEAEVGVMNWIFYNTPENSTILAPLKYGHLITSQAKRKNVIDSNFILAVSSEERYGDIGEFYSTSSSVDAVKILDKYGVDFIFADRNLNFELLSCFRLVYGRRIKIYESNCFIESRRIYE